MGSLSDEEGTAGKGHVTNYAQNVNGTVWSLAMLKKHMGEHQGGKQPMQGKGMQ